jgi:hypothetical protein
MVYAMWFRVDSIAFPLRADDKIIDWSKDEEMCSNYGKGFSKAYSKHNIYIGTTGQLYYMGKTINIEDIPKIISKLIPEEGRDKYIGIVQPPITNNPNAIFVLRVKSKLKKMKFENCIVYWG